MTTASRSPRRRRPRSPASHTLDELRQVRALAHPLRLRLLEVFALGPCTTKQAAERLGQPPTRLYHHVYAMERAGLLRLRETRPNRGTVEKYFEAVARSFGVSPKRLEHAGGRGGAHAAIAIAEQLVEGLREDVRVGLPRSATLPAALKPVLARKIVHAGPAGIRALRRELVALVRRRRLRGAGARSEPGLRYVLTLAFMPAPLEVASAPGATAAGRARRRRRSR